MNVHRSLLSTALAGLIAGLAACDSEGSDPAPISERPEAGAAAGAGADRDAAPPSAGAAADSGKPDPGDFAGCERGSLEDDLRATPLSGRAILDGALRPGEYLFATTYLQLEQDQAAQRLFEQLTGPVVEELQRRPGMLAYAFGQSQRCGVMRTLTVWEDDVAMLGFVTSPAHAAAMARIGEVSRGGSISAHWLGDATRASWEVAASELALSERPIY